MRISDWSSDVCSSDLPAPAGQPGLIQATPVRSGQQVYADNRDLTVLTTVGAGAEVLADGSVHIYGALRGRALAGAPGDETARHFCRAFHARSEERRVGKECVRTGRTRGSADN